MANQQKTPPKLSKVSPLEVAIHNLDETIKELRKRREELMALLPKQRTRPARGAFVDPRTGEEITYSNRR